MKSVKSLARSVFAAIALSAVAAPAHACFVGPCPRGMFEGLDAQQNAGFGPFGVSAGPFSLSLPGSSGHVGPWNWGLNAQQNSGFGPFGVSAGPFSLSLPGSSGNFGPFSWGLNAQQNVGFPGSNFGPFSWGISPGQTASLFFPFPPGFGMNPMAPMGFSGQAVPAYQAYPVMVPYPVQMQQSQGSGVQPVQCSINQVPALTKSVDDCEKAGGDVPGLTKASVSGEPNK